ncbi:hypothetical protein PC116_g27661 [Phytophthora cactorum]|uniref:DDE Tnp4 domain-containing protein n=1 Tax=Phytophthora cactorum TaxID=29920 RepID=A0A8T1JKH9_9STRA|nr:hypothetical protein PC111_g23099 [Phytophthora cactorum]KAG2873069.1 hypothetical protein PC114_g26040 [Phytophthora cactorum]KAG2878135.1 hypothetical protein PC115_g23158 [Phytophthora cactorum]KAG4223880.1 hypothetical protein PC116_g27661 [Phytophthora cactorum]
MPSTATQVIERLYRQWEDETSNLVASHENFGDVVRHVEKEASDSGSPILVEYRALGGDDTLRGMTNFSAPELDALWEAGLLKHYDTWQKHAIGFNIGMSTLEKMAHRVIQTVEPVFRHIDPVVALRSKKFYFLAKHKPYGFKIECSVAPPGVAVDVSDHSPGSTSDLMMMLDRLSIHRQMLRKEGPEIGGEPTQFPQMWTTLVDKGYQGAGRVLRTIQPKKQSRGGTLDRDDIARDRAVSADRVLVEKIFGRMCMLWKATYATFKWNENRFDSVARLCAALTISRVGLMPLRARDSDHYDMVLSKYQSMGERVRMQRARAQRQYRMRQLRSRPASYCTRMSASERETQYESDDSFSFAL